MTLKLLVKPGRMRYFCTKYRYCDAKQQEVNINSSELQNFLLTLKEKLHLKTKEDWILLTQNDIKNNEGKKFLNKFTMCEIKCTGFPEGKDFFLNQKKPSKYWDNEENVKLFLKNVQEKLNLQTIEDWNKVSSKQIKNLGGGTLLNKLSLNKIKAIGFPEGKEFFVIDSKLKPPKYWKNIDNIKLFLQKLKKNLNLNTVEDWNSITKKDIQNNGGGSLLQNISMYNLKCIACPEGKNLFSKPILSKSIGFWDKKENILVFLSNLSKKLNLKTIDDWNNITQKDIIDFGGRSLLKSYSIIELKTFGFPDGESKFLLGGNKKPFGFWKNKDNIEQYLQLLKEKLKLKSPDDWNKLTKKSIQMNGGSGLTKIYSMYEIKCMGCNEGKGTFSNIQSTKKSQDYWDDENNIQIFIEKIKKNLEITSHYDWNRISRKQILKFGGRGLLLKYSKYDILNKIIPDYINKDLNSGRSSQRWLFLQIQKLFPGEEIIEDYYHSELSRSSGFNIQFDIFLVERKIAFEYHGRQHYEDVPIFASLEMHRNRDLEKEKLCKDFGITLIIIPFWWDNKLDSLRKTVEEKTAHLYN